MLWGEWLATIAPILGVTTAQAGILLGLFFPLIFSLCGGLTAPKYPVISMGIPAFFGILVFTYAAWLPLFTGTAIALIVALLVARELSG